MMLKRFFKETFRRSAGGVVFFLSFAVYLFTLCPSLGVGDCGEFITAAATLSLAHPPAYPLYALLGKLFCFLIPWGSLAFRVNLVSAVFSALAAGILAEIISLTLTSRQNNIEQPDKSYFFALIGGLILAFAPTFWSLALVSEVFALNSFFICLLILILLRAKGEKDFYLLAFLFGLGLGNHHTLFLILPAIFYWWWKEIKLKQSLRLNFGVLFFTLTGLSVYFFLPIRSALQPPLNFGHPDNWERFWRVFTRADYGTFQLSLDKQNLPAYQTLLTYCSWLGKNILADFTWLGTIVTVLGLYSIRRKRTLLLMTLIIFLIAGPLFLYMGKMPLNAQSMGVLKRFYILPEIVVVCWLVYGLCFIKEKIANIRSIFYVTIVCLLAFWMIKGWQKANYRENYIAYDYGHNLLKTLPANTYFFMDGGDDTFFSLAYLCFAEKLRTDLKLHDRGAVVFNSAYGPDFRRLPKDEKEPQRRQVETNLLQSGNTLFYSTFNDNVLGGIPLKMAGILYRALRSNAGEGFSLAATETNYFSLYSQRGILKQAYLDDYRTRALVPIYPYFEGFWFWQKGAQTDAFKKWDKAVALGGDVDWVKSNLSFYLTKLGYDAYQKEEISAATRLFEKSLAINPQFAPAYCNLGAIYEQNRQAEKAEELYLKAIQTDPVYAAAHYNLAVIYWSKQNWPAAVSELEKTLQIEPNHPSARYYLTQAKKMLSPDHLPQKDWK